MQFIVENYLGTILHRYFDFNGRSRRREFWYFVLANFIISCVLGILTSIIKPIGFVSSLYGLAIMLPGLGIAVRRLHDIDKSWPFLLIALIPLVGVIVLIVFYCTEGTRGPNRFGPDPNDPYSSNAYQQSSGSYTYGTNYNAAPPTYASAPPTGQASCPHCGTALPPGKRFCPNCGSQMS